MLCLSLSENSYLPYHDEGYLANDLRREERIIEKERERGWGYIQRRKKRERRGRRDNAGRTQHRTAQSLFYGFEHFIILGQYSADYTLTLNQIQILYTHTF